MLKTSQSSPQLFTKNGTIPVIATVSDVDKAVLEKAQGGGKRDMLSSRENYSNSAPSSTRDPKLCREVLRSAMKAKRQEIKAEQNRLSSSLTTALCKSEESVLQNKKWMDEIKDLNSSFGKIPPITTKKKVCNKGQSYYVDF